MAKFPLILLACAASLVTAQDRPADKLSFAGPWLVRLEGTLQSLRTGDFDGDGRTDIAVVNNDKARIELLLQRERGRPVPPQPAGAPRNVPADDPVFEKKGVLTEARIGGFVTGDFNGDGRADLAWYGTPRALVVAFQGKDGVFEQRRTFEIDDGSDSVHALQAADLDRDGRLDLVLLAAKEIVVIRQGEGGLGEPERHANVVEKAGYLRVGDFDGDGQPDLLLLDNNDERPLHLRLSRPGSLLGPETAFRGPPLRMVRVLGGDPARLLVIPQASGTLRAVRLRREDAAGGLASAQIEIHPFAAKSAERPAAFDVGDVDRDGRADVVVADPLVARLLVFRQSDAGTLEAPAAFPSYKEVSALRIADFDGDGHADIAVLSASEKSVGLQTWDGKRLSFPAALQVAGTPQRLEACDVDGDARAEILVAVKEKGGARLVVCAPSRPDRSPKRVELNGVSDVDGLAAGDLDGDGRPEVVVFVPYEPPRVLRAQADGALEELPADRLYQKASLQGVPAEGVSLADLDGSGRKALLFSKEGFARVARLDASGAFTFEDQLNAPPNGKVVAAVAAELDGKPGAEAALIDEPNKRLRLFARKESGTFEESASLDLGGGDFRRIVAADVTGDGRTDLVLGGTRQFGVLVAGKAGWTFADEASYECDERDAFLLGAAIADLGGPAGEETVVIDSGNHALEILARQDSGWRRLQRWPVFEVKTFERGSGRDRPEPHDLALADVSGDGRPDIVLLAHDRVVIYPRE